MGDWDANLKNDLRVWSIDGKKSGQVGCYRGIFLRKDMRVCSERRPARKYERWNRRRRVGEGDIDPDEDEKRKYEML